MSDKPTTLKEAVTDLHIAMANFVNAAAATFVPLLKELQQKGYITSDGKLTAKGRKALKK